MLKKQYMVSSAVGAFAGLNAYEVKQTILDSQAKQEIKYATETNADFTQANCDLTNPKYVPKLPGFRAADTWPCSYAGTVNGNEDGSHQLFYWMYPAINADAPVVLWFNGGPGASSTFANFLFSSPLRIEYSNDAYDMFTTAETWIDQATVIYIDQPVGTGFSYGEPLLTTMEEAAAEFVTMMTNIMAEYPDLASKDIYMTGESYAGKFIPRFSWALHEAGGFNLKASLIGDPYTAPLTQRTHTYLVPEALNIIDDSNMPQIAALQKSCQETIALNLEEASDACKAILNYVSQVSGNVSPYDNRVFDADWNMIEDPVIGYFTLQNQAVLETIQAAIHVSDSTKIPVFEMKSPAVGKAFVMDNLIDYSNYVEKLIEAKSPVLIYAGEFDSRDGPKTQELWLRKLAFEGSEDFWSQSRQIYWVQNSTNPDPQLINGGYWRTSDFFEYLTVPKAGHFVPNNYYSPTISFLADYIASKKLVCHKTDETQCSVVQKRCDAMNNCSEHGSCDGVTGQCLCDAGYKFADCSKQVIDFKDDGSQENISTYGPIWQTMQYAGDKSTKISIATNVTSDIYILKNAAGDPNNFVYDFMIKNVLGNVTFDANKLQMTSSDGYSIAMYVNGVDENSNELLYSNVELIFSEGASTVGLIGSVLAATVILSL